MFVLKIICYRLLYKTTPGAIPPLPRYNDPPTTRPTTVHHSPTSLISPQTAHKSALRTSGVKPHYRRGDSLGLGQPPGRQSQAEQGQAQQGQGEHPDKLLHEGGFSLVLLAFLTFSHRISFHLIQTILIFFLRCALLQFLPKVFFLCFHWSSICHSFTSNLFFFLNINQKNAKKSPKPLYLPCLDYFLLLSKRQPSPSWRPPSPDPLPVNIELKCEPFSCISPE